MNTHFPPYWKRRRAFLFLFMPLAFVGLTALVMWLWNTLLPPLFGLPVIGFWQALGLFVLCRLLFGSFRFGPRGGGPPSFVREGWKEKWKSMSEEERLSFKSKWRDRCKPKEDN